MKKFFLTAVALSTMMLSANAQTEIKVYDSCDTNQDNAVTIADAVKSVDRMVGNENGGNNVVTAKQLNDLLTQLNSRLINIERKLGVKSEYDTYDETDELTHDCVDLELYVNGTNVYFAKTNLGAALPADMGTEFFWGKTNAGTFDSNFFEDGYSISGTKYDVAHEKWGDNWFLPTRDEWNALMSQCSWTYATEKNSNGENVSGVKVYKKGDPSTTDNYIFLPAGVATEEYMPWGYYWSSSMDSHDYDGTNPDGKGVYSFKFGWSGYDFQQIMKGAWLANRLNHLYIRPVKRDMFIIQEN